MKKESITDICVFIPFYNEEKLLENNTKKVISSLEKFSKSFKIILVDDSSSDNSSKIGKSLEQNKNILYIRYENGPSRRENLAKTMKDYSLQAKILAFLDIDLATDINQLENLINYIKKQNYDISIGSRYMGKKPNRSLFRKIISHIYNFLLHIILNSKIKDHQCGFKAFKSNIISELIKEAGYDSNLTRGWMWDAEILIRAQRKGLKIKEFPVDWISGDKSSFDFLREAKMLIYMLKLRRKLK